MRWPNGSQNRPNISSAFGPRGPGIGSSIHRGVDLTGCDPVRAVAAGQVVAVGTPAGWSGGGTQVWIQHDGFFTRSCHMGGWNVGVGQWVDEAAILGPQDTTGTATGSHLHLEVTPGQWHTSNSGQVDPIQFIGSRISGNTAGSGASGETAQLQLDLNTIGYPTEVDGEYGPATTTSVTAFQQDHAAEGVTVDGQAGPQTLAWVKQVVTNLQNALVKVGYSLTVDGQSGPQTVGAVKDFQGKNGLTVDGIAGPATNAALAAKGSQPIGSNTIPTVRSTADVQRLVGLTGDQVDGIYGPNTTAAVLTWQKANGVPATGSWDAASDAKGFPPTPAAYIPIAVTEKWDVPTVRALQASLGFTGADIDGDRGPKTIKAQQVATGMQTTNPDGAGYADGVDGPETVRYLQASLGVRQDGQAGVETLRALQTLLNDGRKLLPGRLDPVETPTEHPKPAAPEYPRADRWGWSPNSSPRQGRVQVLVGHHWGMWPPPSADAQWDAFMRAGGGNPVSPNLQINSDGTSFEPTPPTNNRAWTTGALDHQAITFEMQNASGPSASPPWGFSPEALEEAAQYLAWGHKQFGIPLQRGKVTGTTTNPVVEVAGFVGHNETPAGKATGTTCPGSLPYDAIIVRAKEIVAGTTPTPDPGGIVITDSERLSVLAAAEDLMTVLEEVMSE